MSEEENKGENQLESEEQAIWYVLPPGSKQQDGPLSIREIDVRIRTNEITSAYHAWREGLDQWRRFYEIPELKHLIMESHGEVLTNEAVQSYVLSKLNKNGKQAARVESEEEVDDFVSPPDEDEDNSDLYYFNKTEGHYKVFNPATKVWTASATKPSQERIQELRHLQEEAKKFIDMLKSEISIYI